MERTEKCNLFQGYITKSLSTFSDQDDRRWVVLLDQMTVAASELVGLSLRTNVYVTTTCNLANSLPKCGTRVLTEPDFSPFRPFRRCQLRHAYSIHYPVHSGNDELCAKYQDLLFSGSSRQPVGPFGHILRHPMRTLVITLMTPYLKQPTGSRNSNVRNI